MPWQPLELLNGHWREVHRYLHKRSHLLTVLLNTLISIHIICLWNSSITQWKVLHWQARLPDTSPQKHSWVDVGHYLTPFVLFLIRYYTRDAFPKYISPYKPEKFPQRFTPGKEDKGNRVFTGAAVSKLDIMPLKTHTLFFMMQVCLSNGTELLFSQYLCGTIYWRNVALGNQV